MPEQNKLKALARLNAPQGKIGNWRCNQPHCYSRDYVKHGGKKFCAKCGKKRD